MPRTVNRQGRIRDYVTNITSVAGIQAFLGEKFYNLYTATRTETVEPEF